jgi:hypothetical protein
MEKNKELENLRIEFVTQFNRQKLEEMTLEEYALNLENNALSKRSFCYWVETLLRGLGSIQGSTAIKFGVYFGKVKSDQTKKYRWASWTNESFDTIRNALVDLYDTGEREDINAIVSNPISPMFKGKLLSLYFPNRYLNILSVSYLHHFLNKLSIKYNNGSDPVILREALLSYKQTHPEFMNKSAIEFGHSLGDKFDWPSPKKVQHESAEKLYENTLKDLTNTSLNDVIEYTDIPEVKPEQIVTSHGLVYKIDPAKSLKAIIDSGYSCEIDNNHVSFIRKSNGYKYTEAHHLIPRSFQNDFEYSLDVTANIVSLCSNCHNWLHYGTDIEDILRKLYNERIERLRAVGLDISLEQLISFY